MDEQFQNLIIIRAKFLFSKFQNSGNLFQIFDLENSETLPYRQISIINKLIK